MAPATVQSVEDLLGYLDDYYTETFAHQQVDVHELINQLLSHSTSYPSAVPQGSFSSSGYRSSSEEAAAVGSALGEGEGLRAHHCAIRRERMFNPNSATESRARLLLDMLQKVSREIVQNSRLPDLDGDASRRYGARL
ncbi:hypothetical protein NLG97_g1784 [Lecanicillium saksenae]|uniref:Uncharacterized protein n=1 Tax=Lecanicillium saksenae TaxID=468837 RepID=A0ACC1R415_9HYPO|nr:hypothetical protein NLG97_g1784 [Lecanicillium saksenae]